jgi:hypothetical protein
MINSNAMKFEILAIRNSPVEFLVAGPRGSRNGILIKSDDTKLDLIGFAARESGHNKYSEGILLLFYTFFPFLYSQSRRKNSVKSSSLRMVDCDRSLIRGHDERDSEYKFCWIGECSPSDMFAIEKVFNLYIEDVLKGLEDADNDLVEWSIAPVVLRCSQAKLRLQKTRNLILAITVIYSIAGLVYLLMAASRFSL